MAHLTTCKVTRECRRERRQIERCLLEDGVDKADFDKDEEWAAENAVVEDLLEREKEVKERVDKRKKELASLEDELKNVEVMIGVAPPPRDRQSASANKSANDATNKARAEFEKFKQTRNFEVTGYQQSWI